MENNSNLDIIMISMNGFFFNTVQYTQKVEKNIEPPFINSFFKGQTYLIQLIDNSRFPLIQCGRIRLIIYLNTVCF